MQQIEQWFRVKTQLFTQNTISGQQTENCENNLFKFDLSSTVFTFLLFCREKIIWVKRTTVSNFPPMSDRTKACAFVGQFHTFLHSLAQPFLASIFFVLFPFTKVQKYKSTKKYCVRNVYHVEDWLPSHEQLEYSEKHDASEGVEDGGRGWLRRGRESTRWNHNTCVRMNWKTSKSNEATPQNTEVPEKYHLKCLSRKTVWTACNWTCSPSM